MKNITNIYDYFFYSIYNEFKKIYPSHLDPAFYSIMAMLAVILFLLMPIIYYTTETFFNHQVGRAEWIIGGFVIFGVNIWYFRKERIISIEQKFKDQGLKKKYRRIVWILLILALLFFFMTLKKIEMIN